MGKYSTKKTKQRAEELWSVGRVWDRREEPDGTRRYLTSWEGCAEKTWEPLENFSKEALVFVTELERILDDGHKKPQWFLDFEDQKARGVNVLKHTPGWNSPASKTSPVKASGGVKKPESTSKRREQSTAGSRVSRASEASSQDRRRLPRARDEPSSDADSASTPRRGRAARAASKDSASFKQQPTKPATRAASKDVSPSKSFPTPSRKEEEGEGVKKQPRKPAVTPQSTPQTEKTSAVRQSLRQSAARKKPAEPVEEAAQQPSVTPTSPSIHLPAATSQPPPPPSPHKEKEDQTAKQQPLPDKQEQKKEREDKQEPSQPAVDAATPLQIRASPRKNDASSAPQSLPSPQKANDPEAKPTPPDLDPREDEDAKLKQHATPSAAREEKEDAQMPPHSDGVKKAEDAAKEQPPASLLEKEPAAKQQSPRPSPRKEDEQEKETPPPTAGEAVEPQAPPSSALEENELMEDDISTAIADDAVEGSVPLVSPPSHIISDEPSANVASTLTVPAPLTSPSSSELSLAEPVISVPAARLVSPSSDRTSEAKSEKVPEPPSISSSGSIRTVVPNGVGPSTSLSDRRPQTSHSADSNDHPNAKVDPATGTMPLLPSDFLPFDWPAHLQQDGGEPAPRDCFWERRITRFCNPFGEHIGKLLKCPDVEESFDGTWCTVGEVIAVEGPWVKVHALDTVHNYDQWHLASDAGLQPFKNYTDDKLPKCKEPIRRKATTAFKLIVERAMFTAEGVDMRVPEACFTKQTPWIHRPIKNGFKVGHKLETYSPHLNGAFFNPASVVAVHEGSKKIDIHIDGHPETETKTISFDDSRLFPCGFAAGIGWKCEMPVIEKKQRRQGELKIHYWITTVPRLFSTRTSSNDSSNADDVYIVEGVWERRQEKDGSYRYFTTWDGFPDDCTWEPASNFSADSIDLVRELDRILDDPTYPKPQWYVDYQAKKWLQKQRPSSPAKAHGKRKTNTPDAVGPSTSRSVHDAEASRLDAIRLELLAKAERRKKIGTQKAMNYSRGSEDIMMEDEIRISPDNDGRSHIPAEWHLMSAADFNSKGILLPIEGLTSPSFDWIAHFKRTGGSPAPPQCFWKRPLGQFVNPFEGQPTDSLLKVPDFSETFENLWCTVGEIKATHGPWVKIHAISTEKSFDEWYMANDVCLNPFINLTDETNPKCKAPNRRKVSGNWRRVVEGKMFSSDGTDMRIPAECFVNKVDWKHRPFTNHFKVGHKLETYDPIYGEGFFLPATVVEIVGQKEEMIKLHFDGFPDSQTKILSFKDYRLFPCGFASAIGWQCLMPVGEVRQEKRGRKKTWVNKALDDGSTPASPDSPPDEPLYKKIRRAATTNQTRARSTDSEDEPRITVQRQVQLNQPHRTRAPVIPGLKKRSADESAKNATRQPPAKRPALMLPSQGDSLDDQSTSQGRWMNPSSSHSAAGTREVKREEALEQRALEEARRLETLPEVLPRPPSSIQILDDDEDVKQHTRDVDVSAKAAVHSHSGLHVKMDLRRTCHVGPLIDQTRFSQMDEKMTGSLPNVWRELLQQLINRATDRRAFISCLPQSEVHSKQPLLHLYWDDGAAPLVDHPILAPTDVNNAMTQLRQILAKAGMCPNAITFYGPRNCDRCNLPPTRFVPASLVTQQRLQQARPEVHHAQQRQQPGPSFSRSALPPSLRLPVQQLRVSPGISRILNEPIRSNGVQLLHSHHDTLLGAPMRATVGTGATLTGYGAGQRAAWRPARPAMSSAPGSGGVHGVRVRVETPENAEFRGILRIFADIGVPPACCDSLWRKRVSLAQLSALSVESLMRRFELPLEWARKIRDYFDDLQ